VELELAEGRNHEVRRLFEALGFSVERLVRTRIGNVRLGELKPGRWRVLGPAELRALRAWTDRAGGGAPDIDRASGSPSTLENL
jgi:16S rRNA U516 pseudouridylate synthase RsuA-like enzyme